MASLLDDIFGGTKKRRKKKKRRSQWFQSGGKLGTKARAKKRAKRLREHGRKARISKLPNGKYLVFGSCA